MPRPSDDPTNSPGQQSLKDGFDAPNLDFLLKAVAEQSPNGVIVVDDDGSVVWANQSLCNIFGYQRGELHGKPLENLLPEHLRATHEKLRKGFTAAPKSRGMGGNQVLFGRHRDGHDVPIEIGLTGILHDDKVFSAAYVTDITERLSQSDELQRHRRNLKELEIQHRNLEDLVRERTEDLRLALSSTQSNVKLLNDVMSTLSHEIRTPLNTIIGYAELLDLLHADGTPESGRMLRDYAKFILDAGVNLIGLTQKATNMTMVSTGKVASAIEQIDLLEVLDMARQRNERLKTDHLIDYRFQIPEGLKLRGNTDLLVRALALLFENSAKYSDKDCQVGVSAEVRGGMCHIRIDDNGPGLDPADVHRVFEPFERLIYKHSDISGVGLGLTLARTYVDAMGGRIGIEQSPAGGVRVWIELPVV
ncbi:Sensor protein KdpD [Thalassovita gelatinovora]|uniref:histidine kinase n=1 Tax=Thalassovita gelatinovora TaxID=53501 RepID=A0A0P1F3T1_THAGE|nr:PAS domain-containing sensor histidine kinase [Thalassovita gelatinovora]QIZ81759.1 PAS domain-containing sensor histidine kinase [Thalassovita gelatinovora]CUH62352.1 Sensor protein KdpD [Thalassovita gelatinovora]SER16371.1 PAS/PAC sensor signal transduction histidine kinase [Thalassovita gelatinovora]